MLYQENKPKKHPYVSAVLDYHLRRNAQKATPKNSLYIKSKTA
ncbi:hypothetical protein GCM10007962_07300 [Yeosuana aromativorans]|jgi:hypothetical protein|uniref:Uncharacterized protein n=1 Tax=Yeosuana aromativorans TaxID=288019 RepID=A0A8J3BHZ8_9FLAO|nr:hypothetical protein GCM10007962_07300 [Yeosuana aromativorans]